MSDEKQPPATAKQLLDSTPQVLKEPKARSLKTVEEKYADITLRFAEEYGHTVEPMTPEKERKLKRKLYKYITALVLVINLALFVGRPLEKSNFRTTTNAFAG